MSIPRRARLLLKQRDLVLKAYDKDRITAAQARESLGMLKWQHSGEVWSIRCDVTRPSLIKVGADGATQTVPETSGWLARWWPAIPLAVLSVLALWGFMTSTEDAGRVDGKKPATTTTSTPAPGTSRQ